MTTLFVEHEIEFYCIRIDCLCITRLQFNTKCGIISTVWNIDLYLTSKLFLRIIRKNCWNRNSVLREVLPFTWNFTWNELLLKISKDSGCISNNIDPNTASGWIWKYPIISVLCPCANTSTVGGPQKNLVTRPFFKWKWSSGWVISPSL